MCIHFDYHNKRKYGEMWSVLIHDLDCVETIIHYKFVYGMAFSDIHDNWKFKIAETRLKEYTVGDTYTCWHHENECIVHWTSKPLSFYMN